MEAYQQVEDDAMFLGCTHDELIATSHHSSKLLEYRPQTLDIARFALILSYGGMQRCHSFWLLCAPLRDKSKISPDLRQARFKRVLEIDPGQHQPHLAQSYDTHVGL